MKEKQYFNISPSLRDYKEIKNDKLDSLVNYESCQEISEDFYEVEDSIKKQNNYTFNFFDERKTFLYIY